MLAESHTEELDAGPRKDAAETERFCAATGTVKPVADMIRFVLGPDGAPVPDLKRRLPGRGVWITGTQAALRAAIARKAFARSFKRPIEAPSGLVEMTDRLLERAALDALAITGKARKVVTGFAKVEAAFARDSVRLLVHARDAAADGVRKLNAVARRGSGGSRHAVAVCDTFMSAQLDLALGRSNVVHAAVLAGPECETFLARVERLDRFRTGGPETGRGAAKMS